MNSKVETARSLGPVNVPAAGRLIICEWRCVFCSPPLRERYEGGHSHRSTGEGMGTY